MSCVRCTLFSHSVFPACCGGNGTGRDEGPASIASFLLICARLVFFECEVVLCEQFSSQFGAGRVIKHRSLGVSCACCARLQEAFVFSPRCRASLQELLFGVVRPVCCHFVPACGCTVPGRLTRHVRVEAHSCQRTCYLFFFLAERNLGIHYVMWCPVASLLFLIFLFVCLRISVSVHVLSSFLFLNHSHDMHKCFERV